MRLLSLSVMSVGFSAAIAGPSRIFFARFDEFLSLVQKLCEMITGTPLPDALPRNQEPSASDALLARLNRRAAENKELIDAVNKIVMPVLVALVGGILAVVVVRLKFLAPSSKSLAAVVASSVVPGTGATGPLCLRGVRYHLSYGQAVVRRDYEEQTSGSRSHPS